MQGLSTLNLVSTLRPATFGRSLILRRPLHFNLGQGWGVARKSLFDKPSQIAGALYGQFDRLVIHKGTATVGNLTQKLGSLPASAHKLYGGPHFPKAAKSWDKVTGLGPDIQGFADEFFQRGRDFYPSDKITELRKSVDSVASTATTLYRVVKEAAEQRGIPLYTVSKDLRDTFRVLFEELKEQFPPPDEAPGHKKRTIMIDTILDRVEECFLQVVGKLGVSEALLTSLTGSLKSGLKYVVVTIGDISEQHPHLVLALSDMLRLSLGTNEGLNCYVIARVVIWRAVRRAAGSQRSTTSL